MEGTGIQSIKIYLKQGEEKTCNFDFWLDWTHQSSFSVWCTDEPLKNTSDTGNLRILVMDKSNIALGGAKVVSQSQPDGQLKITGDTASDGTVDFANIKAGKYTMVVSRYNFESIQFDVTITGGMTTNLTINLVATPVTSTTEEPETTIPPY
jgi:hypothetical protein